MNLLFASVLVACVFFVGRFSSHWHLSRRQAQVAIMVIVGGCALALFYPRSAVVWNPMTPAWSERISSPSYQLVAELVGASYRFADAKAIRVTGGVIDGLELTTMRQRHPELKDLRDAQCVVWLTDAESYQIVFGDGIIALCQTTPASGLWLVGIDELKPSQVKALECFEFSVQHVPPRYQ